MRILITCLFLDLTGSSTYTLTLAQALKRKGVDVDVITRVGGILAADLRKAGIPVYNRLRDIAGETYTCLIGQHNSVVSPVRQALPHVPAVFISHGILPSEEQPPSQDTNIQRYIAVSEEVRDNILMNHSIPADRVDLVRNFVDVERFKPLREIENAPRNALLLSNRYTSEVQATLEAACKHRGLHLTTLGKESQARNIEDRINEADLVISLGRGIIEAMSCGRAALVYDYLGGDGTITKENIEEIRKHNFSGRRFRMKYSVQDLMGEIEKYDKAMGMMNRDIVLKEHNASVEVDRVLDICNQAQEMFRPMPGSSASVLWDDPLSHTKTADRACPRAGRGRRLTASVCRFLKKAATRQLLYRSKPERNDTV